MTKIVPVILCGGVGSRLWPLSRQALPKQFLKLYGELSLLQETCLRVTQKKLFTAPILACNEDYRFKVLDELRAIDIAPLDVLLEPAAKSTAPAIALACLLAQQTSPGDLVLALPSDSMIGEAASFLEAVKAAAKLAQEGVLVTFGAKPDKPATGYGYIQRGEKAGGGFRIARFVEKPPLAKAKQMFRDKKYLWNCGMFLFDPAAYLEELKRFEPAMVKACQAAMKAAERDGQFLRPGAAQFGKSPSKSIDYAVMEHTDKAAVVPLETFWSDVGNWASLWEVVGGDAQGNSILGDVIAKDVENSYLRAESKLLVTIGMKDTVVVETRDAVLVCDKAHADTISDIVSTLKQNKRREMQSYPQEYRPWGHYENYNSDGEFLVKRIVVNPFSKLSLQMHKHRSEHWVIVKGTAVVTRGDERIVLREGQSTYIPKGTKHRLENPTATPLVIVEVQTGEHLSEDDIVRYEDVYGRAKAP